MIYLLYALHVLICLFLILVVLLQQGKGADLSVFGGGSTLAAFGARSATTLLHRLTVGAFVAFVLTTLLIAYLKATEARSIVQDAPAAAVAAPPSEAPMAEPGLPAEGGQAESPAAAPAAASPSGSEAGSAAPADSTETPSRGPSEAPPPGS